MHFIVEQTCSLALLGQEGLLEGGLANLTLQVLPDVGVDSACQLEVPFAVKPRAQAAQANVAHGSTTFAGRDQLMFR